MWRKEKEKTEEGGRRRGCGRCEFLVIIKILSWVDIAKHRVGEKITLSSYGQEPQVQSVLYYNAKNCDCTSDLDEFFFGDVKGPGSMTAVEAVFTRTHQVWMRHLYI